MPKLLIVGAVLLLLDVFPGGCGGCGRPATVAGPCQTSCDCDPKMNAPIRCPGQWACNPDKLCEYSCAANDCLEDGGCATNGEVCNGLVCAPPRNCP